MALADNIWKWAAGALLTGVVALLTLSWQAAEHEQAALAQLYGWTNTAQDGRLTVLETRQEDVRKRLSELESKYTYETVAALNDMRKRLERIESRLDRLEGRLFRNNVGEPQGVP